MQLLTPFAPLLPESILTLGAFALLIFGVFRPHLPREAVRLGWLAIVVLAVTAWALLRGEPHATLFGGAFVDDGFARFVKLLILAGAGGALVLCFEELAADKSLQIEVPSLALFATAGMFIMASAGDLIALYLGLELQSLSLYVLAAIRRDNARSSEAGLKYFVLGALSSGMLLYGASLLYGFAGSTSFATIAKVATGGAGTNLMLIFGLVFLMVGIAFKISAVPFHMWTPDVYEGAPTPVTAFLAAAPKVAAMALFVRVAMTALPGVKPQWQQILVFLSVASMLVGALGAIGQGNIKRLMAYSSIANMGYALIPLIAGGADGIQGVLYYMTIYVVMTLGSFACILAMRRGGQSIEGINELAGLSQTNLPMAFAFAMFMFSLAGIPPLAGFFGKFYAFLPAIRAGWYWLAVIGVVTSVIGAYYYLRIVKIMFFDEPKPAFAAPRGIESVVIALSLLLVIGFMLPFIASPLLDAAAAAAASLK